MGPWIIRGKAGLFQESHSPLHLADLIEATQFSGIKEIEMHRSDFEDLKYVALFLGVLFVTLLLAAMLLWVVACHVVLWCKILVPQRPQYRES